jgi:hypothetical protein
MFLVHTDYYIPGGNDITHNIRVAKYYKFMLEVLDVSRIKCIDKLIYKLLDRHPDIIIKLVHNGYVIDSNSLRDLDAKYGVNTNFARAVLTKCPLLTSKFIKFATDRCTSYANEYLYEAYIAVPKHDKQTAKYILSRSDSKIGYNIRDELNRKMAKWQK